MKTVYPVKARAQKGDLKLVVTGRAVYYLRCYSDGTFDVFAHEDDGEIIAIAAISFDGVANDAYLEPRRCLFAADNGLE